MRLNIRTAALAFAAALTLTATAAAVGDADYSGALDPVTGLTPEAAALNDSGRVSLPGGYFFDRATQSFVYPVGAGLSEVRAGVADGMTVSAAVRVEADEGAAVQVFRNGTELGADELPELNTPGQYVVYAQGAREQQLFDFTIVGETTNLLHSFDAPDGFVVTAAERDGADAYTGRYAVDMEQEGSYRIEYSCPATGMSYTLETTIDRTPPRLTFDGKIGKDGRVRSALTFSGVENGDSVYVMLDGEPLSVSVSDGAGRLTDSGSYVLDVYDAAGNAAEYTFTIMIYFDGNSLLFFLLVLLALGGVVGYVLFQKKRLRVA